MSDRISIHRALLSVSDKTGLVELGTALAQRGVELVSTGGSAATLRAAGLDVRDVAELTGSPEMMDGRVKTLHPKVHGGLLALRDNAEHIAAMTAHDIAPIDLLVVNLYPFEQTVARGAPRADVIENIDIGGPAMIRAAAKNHGFVTTLVDPEDYAALLDELDAHDGTTSAAFRSRMAGIAYARTAAYDAAVAAYFAAEEDSLPRRITVAGSLREELRYGENPHQRAGFYVQGEGLGSASQLQGKPLSYNNINDTNAALELAAEFTERPACVIVKHANPCGVAEAETLAEAYRKAFDCDRTSAFGGIVALNRPLDGPTATAIAEIFTEVVIAPDADDDARAILGAKKNLRLLTAPLPDATRAGLMIKPVWGGFLAQSRDNGRVAPDALKLVTERAPTPEELRDMQFAWIVARHVASNAIVYARDGATVGIGAGQMNRLDSTLIAARRAERMQESLGLASRPTEGAAVASDAFFPFADGLIAAAEAGATAIIQPGGSVRDEEVIAAANERGLTMMFTAMRHFRH